MKFRMIFLVLGPLTIHVQSFAQVTQLKTTESLYQEAVAQAEALQITNVPEPVYCIDHDLWTGRDVVELAVVYSQGQAPAEEESMAYENRDGYGERKPFQKLGLKPGRARENSDGFWTSSSEIVVYRTMGKHNRPRHAFCMSKHPRF